MKGYKLYTSEEKIIIWVNNLFDQKQLKLFLLDITSPANNYHLAKKYNLTVGDITWARKFSDVISHYIIDTVLKAEQQRDEPVRLWYGNVA